MEIRRGIGVSSGYAIGEAHVFDREEFRINKRPIAPREIDPEVARLKAAVEAASTDLRRQIEALPAKIREEAGSILRSQIENLQNKVLHEEIFSEIRKNLSTAEYAASRTVRRKMKLLQDSGNEAFVKRILPDLEELERAILRNLLGARRDDNAGLVGRVVIVAHDLSPGQALRLDRKKVIGILTEVGGLTSHTAIVAKSLGIPAVVGVEGVTSDVSAGDMVLLDGASGTVIISPDEGTLKRYQAMERNFALLEQTRAKELHDLPAVTKDGTHIEIFANIEAPEEIPEAIEYGAEGIGLYRTEFLYLENQFSPTEKDHLEAYGRATTLLGKRKIIIRTVDLGADKMSMDGYPRESNPFLGTRAIRLCFERPEIFKTQLRAILKSASHGNVGMMIPMISSLSEVVQVKEAVEDVRRELRREEEPTGEGIEIGIMIEIPSAAIIADMLAPHVDFFSVGTNDLIAYSVAVDRANERVASLYQPAHPAVLRLLKHVIEAGAKHGKPVSVCGEMSSDLNFTPFLLGIGLRHFSVASPVIPDLKKLIRNISIPEAQAISEKAFTFEDGRETLEYLKGKCREYLPDSA